MIENILFPVDFSPPCAAMAAYVKWASVICGARVTLVHVFDLTGHNGFELYVQPLPEIADEHRELADHGPSLHDEVVGKPKSLILRTNRVLRKDKSWVLGLMAGEEATMTRNSIMTGALSIPMAIGREPKGSLSGLAALTFVLACAPASRATVTGTISGIVTDPSGAVIPDANVVAVNTQTGVKQTTVTDSRGFTRSRRWRSVIMKCSSGSPGSATISKLAWSST
jgi:hypothetical protein